LLYRKIAKEQNLEERQLYDDGDPSQSAKSKAISIWLTLWTMCQIIDATIDVDRFF
jgi:hypothetical protein